MSVLSNTGIRAGASGVDVEVYEVANSLRFNEDDSATLNKPPRTQGNRKTWTYSTWVKRCELGRTQSLLSSTGGGTDDSGYLQFGFRNTDILEIGGALTWWLQTDAVFRDNSWYHIVCAVDTTNSTADDRIKLYVNGSQITSFATRNNPAQYLDLAINQPYGHYIGAEDGSANYLHAYMAEIHMVDGLQLDASSFGETATTGQWVPIEYTHVTATDAYHVLNDGTAWRDDLTSNVGFYTGEHEQRAFNGDDSNYASVATGGAANYIDFVCNISVASSIRVKVSSSTNSVHINGSGSANVSGTDWLTVVSPPATLTQLRVYGSSGVGARIYAIEVDGIVLIDDAADNSFHLKFDPTESGATYSDGTNNTADSSGVVNSHILDVLPVSNTFCYPGTGYTGWGPEQIFGLGGRLYTYYSTATCKEYKIDLAALKPGVTITSLRLYIRASYLTNTSWRVSVLDSSKTIIGSAQEITLVDTAWFDIPVSGSPRYIKLDNIDDTSSRRCILEGIEINGEVLIDHTAIGYDSSGNKNHWHENNFSTLQGTGNYLRDGTITGSPSSASYHMEKLFNGVQAGTGAQSDGGLTYKITFGSALTGTNIYVIGDNTDLDGGSGFEFNDTTATTSNTTRTGSSAPYRCKLDGVTSLASITVGTSTNIQAIEIDGVILVDNRFAVDYGVSTDSPATYDDEGNGVGNYCTLNPLDNGGISTLSNGNLKVQHNATNWKFCRATQWMTTGKWYWETAVEGAIHDGSNGQISGICSTDGLNNDSSSAGKWTRQGQVKNDELTNTTVFTTVALGQIFGWAYDADAGKLWTSTDGTWEESGNPATGASENYTTSANLPVTPTVGLYNSNCMFTLNFGQRAFAYTPPTGYKALNTFNLDDTTTLSGEYEGNADADGPVVWMNATPATLKIDTSDPPTSLVTFDPSDVDPLSSGFKIRNSSTNNGSGTTYYWLATTNRAFKYANAQSNE